jgi:hypothetical protein
MIHATANISTTLSSRHPLRFRKLSVKRLIQRLAQPALNRIKFDNPRSARLVCKFIPAQCPFERDVMVFGHKVFHIPAMCQLNPAYDSLMELRFRALTFLADECGEDVTPYCH